MSDSIRMKNYAQSLRFGAPGSGVSSHLLIWLIAMLAAIGALPSLAEQPAAGAQPGRQGDAEGGPAKQSALHILAYSLKHRPVSEALALVRPLLTARGTVEEQRRGNTLVVRDEARVLKHVGNALSLFDVPPKDLRLHIQVVQAGPEVKSVVSPPVQTVSAGELAPQLESRLRGVLLYEDYQVLAQADVPSKEGQPVSYSLGEDYEVSFRLGQVVGERRLKLEDFRIKKRTPSTNKGRQLAPRELYHATLNVWLEKPFMLVLTQDPKRKEALLIAIDARPAAEE